MYSMVLVAALATGSATPAGGLAWSHGCCGGCHGVYYSSCYGCCGGCYGSSYSCYGCYGSYSSCYGCCGYSYGCYGSCYGYSCHGCCGTTVIYSSPYGCCGGSVIVTPGEKVVPPAPAKPAEKLPPAKPGKVSIDTSATVIVAAPMGTKLTVDGQPAILTSTEQAFATPDLEPDATYAYEFKAEMIEDGKLTTVTKRVRVAAGQQVRVDFSADRPVVSR